MFRRFLKRRILELHMFNLALASNAFVLSTSCFAATRKKLFEIAKSFSEKTRRRKTKKRALLKHHSYPPFSLSVVLTRQLLITKSTANTLLGEKKRASKSARNPKRKVIEEEESEHRSVNRGKIHGRIFASEKSK